MPVTSARAGLPSVAAPDDTWALREDPPSPGTLCEGYWPAWGPPGRRHPEQVGLCVKGEIDQWHTRHAIKDGCTRLNMLVFNPTFWRAVEGKVDG